MIALAIRQLTGPRARWIALATLAISLFATPAAAQSGSEAVVCVGSERRTLATNPIRRVYTEDMEIVYRIGADIGQRDQVERDLSSDLGSYPEVWCAWSDPGDDHAVIISYTGVIRQDLTVDLEDPRFQAFSVGLAGTCIIGSSESKKRRLAGIARAIRVGGFDNGFTAADVGLDDHKFGKEAEAVRGPTCVWVRCLLSPSGKPCLAGELACTRIPISLG